MKLIFIMILFCTLGMSAPQKVKVLYDNKAVLHFCPEQIEGCVSKITLGLANYLVVLADPNTHLESFDNLKGSYAFHKLYKTQPGKVTGFLVKESGHMPNPMVKFDVFYLLSFDFISPR